MAYRDNNEQSVISFIPDYLGLYLKFNLFICFLIRIERSCGTCLQS